MFGLEGRAKTGELTDRLGEAGVWIEPADDLDGGILPATRSEDVPDDWLVEMPDLPPGAIGMSDLDLETGDDPAFEVEVESVGLGEADIVTRPRTIDEPSRGDIGFPELSGKI